MLGLEDSNQPQSDCLLQVRCSVRSRQSWSGHATRRYATPRKPDLLVNNYSPLLWAVCCTAYLGFFRLGELLLPAPGTFNHRLHLAWGDVAVDNPNDPRMVRCHLKQSKTDQMGRGVDVVLGRTGLPLCPLAALVGYIAIRGSRPGPFILTAAGVPITKPEFIKVFRQTLSSRRVCGPQLPYWGSHLSSSGGCGGLYDPAPGSVAELGIPPLHPDSRWAPGGTLPHTGITGPRHPLLVVGRAGAGDKAPIPLGETIVASIGSKLIYCARANKKIKMRTCGN